MQHSDIGKLVAATLLVVLVGGCDLLFGPEIRCGPLDETACELAVQQIRVTLSNEYPNRRVVFVEILNDQGHATVRLDDGTEIGFGERL